MRPHFALSFPDRLGYICSASSTEPWMLDFVSVLSYRCSLHGAATTMSHPVQLSIQAPQETSLSSYWAFLRFVKLSLFKMFFSYFGQNFFLEDLISVNTSTGLSVAQASFLGILIDPSSLDPICTSCECDEFLRPLSSKSIVYFLLGEKRAVSISHLQLAPTC